MSQSKKFKIHISSDGTSSGTKTELEGQGDATINTGKSSERVQTKNETFSYNADAGMSITSSFVAKRPLATAQALLWTAHDNDSTVYAWIEDDEASGLSFAGDFRVSISEIDAPVDGGQTHNVTLSAEGTITRGVTV